MGIRFGFIGGTLRGYKLIKALLKNNLIPEFSVILKEDEHENEKYSSEISSMLNKYKVTNQIKKKLTDEDYKKIQESKLDFVIVSGWRTIIDTRINKYIKSGFIAAHQSLLPKYRGFAPLQWAIINGEKETGVTLFQIEDGEIDSGRIISQKIMPINFEEYADEVDKKLIECTIELYMDYFENYNSKTITLRDQNESEATYTCKRIPEDGKIEWNKTSAEVYNLIRALAYPYPGAYCYLNEDCYIIRKARTGFSNKKKFAGNIPGRVLRIYPEGAEILCGKGTVLLQEWENKSTGIVNNPSEIIRSIKLTLR